MSAAGPRAISRSAMPAPTPAPTQGSPAARTRAAAAMPAAAPAPAAIAWAAAVAQAIIAWAAAVAAAVLPFTPAVAVVAEAEAEAEAVPPAAAAEVAVPRAVVAVRVVVAAADAGIDRRDASLRMLDVKPVRPFPSTVQGSSSPGKEAAMPMAGGKIVDISLELDAKKFRMRTPAGFKKDMQFAMEVLKEHDAPGGAGQIVRGVHMRLHAGSHVDAPEHNVRGGTQIHQLPLELFIGEAIVADLRDKMPAKSITESDLDGAIGTRVKRGDRVLLRTDHNNA